MIGWPTHWSVMFYVGRLPWKLSIQPPQKTRGDKPPVCHFRDSKCNRLGATVLATQGDVLPLLPTAEQPVGSLECLRGQKAKNGQTKNRKWSLKGWNQPEQIRLHLKGASCEATVFGPATQAKKIGIVKVSALVDFLVQVQFLLARSVLFPLACSLLGCLQPSAGHWLQPVEAATNRLWFSNHINTYQPFSKET